MLYHRPQAEGDIMQKLLRLVVIVIGALGLWRLLAWRRGKPEPIDPQSLIINPAEAHTPGRFLDLKSVANLRDIGGYKTADGQTVRWQRIYRGASLAFLSPEDGQKLMALGIKWVCDFRSEEEAAADPDILPDSAIGYLPLPALSNVDTRWQRLRILLLERNHLGDTLVDLYTRIMIDNNAALFGKLFEHVADEKNLPLLVHCSAGKDRTGIAMALLLRYLGVPESTVVADYTLSNLYYDYFRKIATPMLQRLAALGIRADEMQPLLVANPNTLQTMLAYVDAKYGSIEKYLREKVGLSDAVLAQVRANLLEK